MVELLEKLSESVSVRVDVRFSIRLAETETFFVASDREMEASSVNVSDKVIASVS